MSIKDQEGLLTMMERGEFTTTKIRIIQTVKANIVIFATSSSIERLVNHCSVDSQFLKFQNIPMKNSKQYRSG
jgi:hypothetical protein